MNRTKLVVLGLIKNNNGEYLISQRFDPDFGDAHLKWDLPGGTNEFGESLEETLKREVVEETGLIVDVLDMMPHSVSKVWKSSNGDVHVILVCYHCVMISGELNTEDKKINDLKWVKPSDIYSFELLSTTKQFLEKLG
ncbi:MAG: NUDIX hydrolase [Patescibacteria group bacterium]